MIKTAKSLQIQLSMNRNLLIKKKDTLKNYTTYTTRKSLIHRQSIHHMYLSDPSSVLSCTSCNVLHIREGRKVVIPEDQFVSSEKN